MNRFRSACLTTLAAGAGLLAAPVAPATAEGAGAPVALAAHHAVYRLTLLSGKGTSAPASASGAIDYDFSGSACDGYTTRFRQLVELQPAEGDAKVNDMKSNTFENDAGTEYTFDTRTSVDDGDPDTVAGTAERGAGGVVGVAIKTPQGRAEFPGGILFPAQHLRRIIAAAERGERILSADVYDGSDTGRKLFRSLAVIGAPLADAPDDPAGKAEALKGMRRWPVVVSYFEDGKDAPDYVLSAELYEDGIERALKLDYGDFVLAGALDRLTVSPPAAPCAK